jgi:large subunit ribosomal protein L22
MIRGLTVDEALTRLTYTRKKSAGMFNKLVRSALANAKQKDGTVEADTLFIKTVFVDQGPSLRRFRPRARGMAYRIAKKTCHMTVILERVTEDNLSEPGE